MANSPFKFLEAYEKHDKDFFFGREKETEALYEMTHSTRLVLFYGASGTGKTSIIKCGLANRFSVTRWQDLYLRKGNHILESLRAALRSEIAKAGGEPLAFGSELEGIEQLHRLTYKPLYLIFDQFEELFISSKEGEQKAFFRFVQDLMNSTLPCKIVLILREEFLASLWDFEKEVPVLFDYRLRIEQFRKKELTEILDRLLGAIEKNGKLRLVQRETLSSAIIGRLSALRNSALLTYLQVYLDRLYQEAQKLQHDAVPEFSEPLVAAMPEFEDVIGDFLDEQLRLLENQLGEEKKGVPIRLLGKLITPNQTKQVLDLQDFQAMRVEFGLTPEEFDRCLSTFEKMRIVQLYE
jgi:hypothetical protein